MVTGGGVSVPNNVAGAVIGALIATIVLWLLGLIHGFHNMPDDVKQAISSLIVVSVTALGGWIEHRTRQNNVENKVPVTPVTKP